MKNKIWFQGGHGSYMAHSGSYPNQSPSLINLGFLLAEEIRTGDDMSWITNSQITDRAGNESYSYQEGNDIITAMEYFDDIPPLQCKTAVS